MTLPFRPRTLPHCSACLRSYAWLRTPESKLAPPTSLNQQVRGKQKNARSSGTVPVRLLKDLVGFGKRGAIVPVAVGEMRNKWFPRRVADYVTMPELRTLHANNVPIERDHSFGRQSNTVRATEVESRIPEQPIFEPPKPKGLEKLTPERSAQLLEIFVKPILDFYRQPIIEQKEEEPASVPPEPKKGRQSAAADLLAVRSQARTEISKPAGPQAIYGSVSTQDILQHVRAAIAVNDEAARVLLTDGDIRFMDEEFEAEGRVKHTGDYTVEIIVKGLEQKVKRTVRVIPQDV